jgi:hypothetical protein
MSYPFAVKELGVSTHQERRIFGEESFIKFIRLIIVPLCILFWYAVYKCCQMLYHWMFV